MEEKNNTFPMIRDVHWLEARSMSERAKGSMSKWLQLDHIHFSLHLITTI